MACWPTGKTEIIFHLTFISPLFCTISLSSYRYTESALLSSQILQISCLGFLWSMAHVVPKASLKIYYTNFHHLVVCKGTSMLFCGKLYPLQCFLKRPCSIKLIWKYDFFFLKEPLERLGSVSTYLLNTCWQLMLLPCAVGFGLCIFFHLGVGWKLVMNLWSGIFL